MVDDLPTPEDKRARKRTKQQKQPTGTRLVEGARVTNRETSHQPNGRSLPRPIPPLPINQPPHTNNLTDPYEAIIQVKSRTDIDRLIHGSASDKTVNWDLINKKMIAS